MKVLKMSLLIVLLISVKAFADDCNDLTVDCWNELPCECCSYRWDGNDPPNLAYIIFQDIERTGRAWDGTLLPAPNNRLFLVEYQPEGCRWSYVDDVWRVRFDLTALCGYNVYLANWVDDFPADMRYFCRQGLTDCRTVYTSELDHFFKGGTARIFWFDGFGGSGGGDGFGDFNFDGIVNFEDYAILANAPLVDQAMPYFAANWLILSP